MGKWSLVGRVERFIVILLLWLVPWVSVSSNMVALAQIVRMAFSEQSQRHAVPSITDGPPKEDCSYQFPSSKTFGVFSPHSSPSYKLCAPL